MIKRGLCFFLTISLLLGCVTGFTAYADEPYNYVINGAVNVGMSLSSGGGNISEVVEGSVVNLSASFPAAIKGDNVVSTLISLVPAGDFNPGNTYDEDHPFVPTAEYRLPLEYDSPGFSFIVGDTNLHNNIKLEYTPDYMDYYNVPIGTYRVLYALYIEIAADPYEEVEYCFVSNSTLSIVKGSSETKELSWSQKALTVDSPIKGKEANYLLTFKPSEAFTVASGDILRIYVPGVNFINAAMTGSSALTMTNRRHGGFDLRFNSAMTVPTDGFSLQFSNAINRNPAATISPYIAAFSTYSSTYETLYQFPQTYFNDITFIASPYINLSGVSKLMYLTVAVDAIGFFSTYNGFSGGSTKISLPDEAYGKKADLEVTAFSSSGEKVVLCRKTIEPLDYVNNLAYENNVDVLKEYDVAIYLGESEGNVSDFTFQLLQDGKPLYLMDGKYHLRNIDNLSVYNFRTQNLIYQMSCDLTSPDEIKEESGVIVLKYKPFTNNMISGTVKDTGGTPVPFAEITATQRINSNYYSRQATADESGVYSVSGLFSGNETAIGVRAYGYRFYEKTDALPGDTLNVSLRPISKTIIVTTDGIKLSDTNVFVEKDGYIISVETLKVSETEYMLILPDNSYTVGEPFDVVLHSSYFADPVTRPVTLDDKLTAAVEFSINDADVVRLGQLDFFGLYSREGGYYNYTVFDLSGNRVISPFAENNYSKYYKPGEYDILAFSGKRSSEAAYAKTKADFLNNLPAGSYFEKRFTIISGETSYVTGTVPPFDGTLKLTDASIDYPKTAEIDGFYKVTGYIESDLPITGLHLLGNRVLVQAIDSVIVNGEILDFGEALSAYYGVWKKKNGSAWTEPLIYTIYIATKSMYIGEIMELTVSAEFGSFDNREFAGRTKTAIMPTLSINVPTKVSSVSSVPYSGRAERNAFVYIYDGQKLLSVIGADASGYFSGMLNLSSSLSQHTIIVKSELEIDGDRFSVAAFEHLTYAPGEACLEELSFVFSNSGLRTYKLPLGGHNLSYTADLEKNKVSYIAKFTNSELLDTFSFTLSDGSTKTGKVFFEIGTTGKTVYLEGELVGTNTYKTDEYIFAGVFPTSVKVLYESKPDPNANAFVNNDGDIEIIDPPVESDRAVCEKYVKDLADAVVPGASAAYEQGEITKEEYISEYFGNLADMLDDEKVDFNAVSALDIGNESAPDKHILTRYTEFISALPASMIGYTRYSASKGNQTQLIYGKVEYYNKNGNRTDPVKYVAYPATGTSPYYTKTVLNPDVGSVLQTVYTVLRETGKDDIIIRDRTLLCMAGAVSPLSPAISPSSRMAVFSESGFSTQSDGPNIGFSAGINPADVSAATWLTTGLTLGGTGLGSMGGLGGGTAATITYGSTAEMTNMVVITGGQVAATSSTELGLIGLSVNGVSQTDRIQAADGQLSAMTASLLEQYRGATDPAQKADISALLTRIGEMNHETGWTGAQNQFTENTTLGLDGTAVATGIVPGWGWAAGGGIGMFSGWIKGANDTRTAELFKELERLQRDFEALKNKYKQEKDKEKEKEDDKDKDKDSETTPNYDPSGYIYEAVASNRLEGATVTLYTNKNGRDYTPEYDADGMLENDAVLNDALLVFDDSYGLNQQNPITSDKNGKYAWDVPQGLWYVEAYLEGYSRGNSNADPAAIVSGENYNWLPVLPPQLDVNIGLVNTNPPEVEDIIVVDDGVYMRFSKYLDETTIIKDNFLLFTEFAAVPFTIEKLDSEESPTIDGVSYTRTVKLAADLAGIDFSGAEFGEKVYLTIKRTVKSYAGSAMDDDYADEFEVEPKIKLADPVFSVAAGKVLLNTLLTLTASDNAEIYYTLNGDNPALNGIKFTDAIVLSRNVTVKAVARKLGFTDSDIISRAYEIIKDDVPQETFTITASAGTGGTITPSGAIIVNKDESATFVISPDNGYKVKEVLVDGDNKGTISQYTFNAVTSAHTIHANFEKTSVTPPPDDGTSTGSSSGGSGSVSPVAPNDKDAEILKKINAAKRGDIITVEMDDTVISSSVLRTMKSKGVKVVFAFKGYSWTIDGNKIKEIPNAVSGYDLRISKAENDATVSKLLDNRTILIFDIAHDGEFPFVATLSYNIDKQPDGKRLYLYGLENDGKKSTYITLVVVKDGKITADFSHASRYAVTDMIIKNSDVRQDLGVLRGYVNISDSSTIVPMIDKDGEKSVVAFSCVIGDQLIFTAPETSYYGFIDNSKRFDDISGHWASNDISFVTSRMLFSGVSSAMFDAEGEMTRGMLVTVIGRLANIDVTQYSGKMRFADVNESAYYAPYIKWASDNSIVSGVGSTQFEPDRQVNREEMAVIIGRFVTRNNYKLTQSEKAAFNDEDTISVWAFKDVELLKSAGILSGMGDGTFSPRYSLTRAQAAAVLRRLITTVTIEQY